MLYELVKLSKGIEILQNIQDVNYNCPRMGRSTDKLLTVTELNKIAGDDKIGNDTKDDDDGCIPFQDIENHLSTLDPASHDISDPQINKRRLQILKDRCKIDIADVQTEVTSNDLQPICGIPDIILDTLNLTENEVNTPPTTINNANDNTYLREHPMIIELITGKILQRMNNEVLLNNEGDPSISGNDLNINLEHLAASLDFKQKAAFEVMATSFRLQALECYNISENALNTLFQVTERENKMKQLKELTEQLSKKGGELQLLMSF